MRKRGIFITFEGIEGAGKTTQIIRARKYLMAKGLEVLVLREPGGTKIGDRIRDLLLTPSAEPLEPWAEFFLFCASRSQLVATVIEPALKRGAIVLCDRFSDSSLAYQGFARGLSTDAIRNLTEIATGGLKPNLTLLLDLPEKKGLGRAHSRQQSGPNDRFESEQIEFHSRVRQGFLALAEQEPDRIKIISADRPADTIATEVEELIDDGI